MKQIHLSKDLALPVDVVTQAVGILAKRRAGKSYLARKLAEQLHAAGQQIVIVDPKGDWWGIRSAAGGKGPGLPVVILGGERGDVKLEPGSGEVVAKLVVEEQVSVLLDLSLLRKHEVSTFMSSFLESLYRLKAQEKYRTPVMLLIDEADAIAPQKPIKGGNEERMLGAAEDIVRRGGQRGIGCAMITQRSAVLNKNLLTQVQVLIALRTIAPQDLAAMNAWIDVHGSEEERKTLMGSLPALPIGDAWVWSPGWPTTKGIFARIHVAPIETFDSGSTPAPGEKRVEPKHLADVDLEALKRQMADTIARQEADDPKKLKKAAAEMEKRVRDLERQLATKKTPAPKILSKRLLTEGDIKRLEKVMTGFRESEVRVIEAIRILADKISAESKKADAFTGAEPFMSLPPGATFVPPKSFQLSRTYAPSRMQRIRDIPDADAGPRASNDGSLPKGERAILIAIAQHGDAGVDRNQLSVLTGYKKTSRDTYLTRLSAKGFIQASGGAIYSTMAGRSALGRDFEPLPSGERLREFWMAKLPAGEAKILSILVRYHPQPVRRSDLDEATGYKKTSRDTYLQRLAARRLVVDGGPGFVRASDDLFEGGR